MARDPLRISTPSIRPPTLRSNSTVDGDRTITHLIFGDTLTDTAASWFLGNNGSSGNNLILAGTTPSITVNALGTGKSTTISAVIQGSSGLAKAGAGTLVLGANNTYTGPTAISAGTLRLGSAGAFGDGVTNTSGVTLTGGAILDLAGFSPTANASLNLNGTAGGFDVGALYNSGGTTAVYSGSVALGANTSVGAGNITLTGPVTGNGRNLKKDGVSTLRLSSNVPVSLAALQANRGTIQLDSGTLLNVTGINIGSGNSVGAGTLSLPTANSHTGLTSVNGGIVNFSGNQAGATGGYALNVVNSATSALNLGSASQTAATTVVTGVSKSIQLGAIPGVNTATSTSAQTVNVTGAAGFPTTVSSSGSLAVARNATLTIGDHSTWNQGGPVNVQANGGYSANLTLGTAAGSSAAMVYSGTSPIQLSQTASTSSISTLTVRGGTLTTGQPVNFNGASGNANGYARLILTTGGKLKLSADIPQLVTGDASGRVILSNGGGGIIDTNGFNTTIDRVLADSNPVTFIGSLTKTGIGKLALANTNTYSGTTTVTGGTLLVTGSISNSAATVDASGTLGGIGTTGSVTLEAGSNLAPGAETPGTLITGPLTLKAGSFSNFRLGSTSDRVNVTGALALGLPPKTPSTTGITLAKPSAQWLFTYTRPADRPDLSYAVEISPCLTSGSWTTAGGTHQRIQTGDPETWQATSTTNPSGKLFWHLRVSLPW